MSWGMESKLKGDASLPQEDLMGEWPLHASERGAVGAGQFLKRLNLRTPSSCSLRSFAATDLRRAAACPCNQFFATRRGYRWDAKALDLKTEVHAETPRRGEIQIQETKGFLFSPSASPRDTPRVPLTSEVGH
jgi:hypothetical protein